MRNGRETRLLYIFSKGELKGQYYHEGRHEGKIGSPVSLFELIKKQHNPAKKWALTFLKKSKTISIQGYHEMQYCRSHYGHYAYLRKIIF